MLPIGKTHCSNLKNQDQVAKRPQIIENNFNNFLMGYIIFSYKSLIHFMRANNVKVMKSPIF